MYQTLNLELKGTVATVTLDRPESRNAMSAQLMREMIACAARIAARRDVDVAIVRGSGACFSAGADLKDSRRWANAAQPLEEQREIAVLGYRMARAWEELPQITLAAIEGQDLDNWLAEVERQTISQALAACHGVQAHAAKKLGITERSLWHRIKKLGIQISRIVT